MGDIAELRSISPEPIGFNDSFLSVPDLEGSSLAKTDGASEDTPNYGPSRHMKLRKFSNSILKPIQKYSSYTFTVFAVVHGVTVAVGPLISTDLGNQMMSMGRAVYQSPGLEEVLVWGSLAVHVGAGIMIRTIKLYYDRTRYGGRVKHSKKSKRKRVSSIVDESAVLEMSQDGTDLEVKDDYEIGLIGGTTSILGLGMRRNFTFRTFGISTLQMSGWLSIPLVLYHLFQVRIIPLLVEGDSSYISFEYITYLFQYSTSGRFINILNWVLYPSLIYTATYHMVYGLMRWNNVKSLKVRKFGVLLINIIGAACSASVLKLSRESTESVAGFVLKKFDTYLDYFYHFRYLR